MSNCNSKNPMAIQLAPIVGAGLGALQQGKIEKAMAGEKIYTKPKTIFGKLIGGISGRTAAAEISTQNKTAPLSSSVINSLQPMAKTSTPISGGISFGAEARQKNYLPLAIIGGLVAVFYFLFGKKKRGGRRR